MTWFGFDLICCLGYHAFVGKDATSSFLDLCFNEDCLKRDWRKFSTETMKGIEYWVTKNIPPNN